MPRVQILGGDAAPEQRLLLAALQVEDGELSVLRRVGHYREQHASAARQHRRMPMPVMRCGLGQRRGLAAVRRNSPESDVAIVTGDDDGAVLAPGSALRAPQLSTERDDWSARDRHFLQVTAVEESNPPAVGRKKRRAPRGDARQQHGVELVECAQHQSTAALVGKYRPSGERAMSRPRNESSIGSVGGNVIVNRAGSAGAGGSFRITAHVPSAAMRLAATTAAMASQ